MTVACRPEETGWNLKTIKVGTVITSLALLGGSLFFRSTSLTLGVLAGASIAFINFVVLQKMVVRITSGTPRRKVLTGILPLLKFALFALLVFFMLSSDRVDPTGLIVGLSTIVVTLALMALVRLFRHEVEKRQ